VRPPGPHRRIADALTAWAEAVRHFYRRPVAWVALLVSSALLTFGGGAVMFWFHAVVRGEEGPAIADAHHWLLDSTLGFVALTPVLALIVPLGVWVAGRRGRGAYVVAVAALFTATTGPGPFLHGLVAGADTPLGRLATRVFGHDGAVAARNMHVHDRSPLAEGLLQVLVGLPVYLGCTWLALRLVRGAVGRARRAAASRAAAGPATGAHLPAGGRASASLTDRPARPALSPTESRRPRAASPVPPAAPTTRRPAPATTKG